MTFKPIPQNAPIFNKAVEVAPKEAEPKPKSEASTVVLSSSASKDNKDKTLSVVNAQPFVPKLKLPAAPLAAATSSRDSSAKTETAASKPSTELVKAQLNPESVAFVPKHMCGPDQNCCKPTIESQPPVGGFGNKQTSIALATEKTIYTEVLVHCIKMSIQEYQKKLKMFNKKVNNKKKYLDVLEPPTIQYINIYAHGKVPRLKCFQRITECSAAFINVKEDDDNEGGYFYGDATSYEKHLEQQLKWYEKALKSGQNQQKKFNQNFINNTIETDFM